MTSPAETLAPTLSGLLLAGGRARRLGGEKATVEIDGLSLIQRAALLGRSCCAELLLLAGERSLSIPGVRQVPDWPRVDGPLGGLGAGLQAARSAWSLLLSCDQPFVTAELVECLTSRLRAQLSGVSPVPAPLAVLFADDHGLQPFCGLYHRDLLPHLRRVVAQGERSLRGALRGCSLLRVSRTELPPELSWDWLFDVDTPADLARARRMSGS